MPGGHDAAFSEALQALNSTLQRQCNTLTSNQVTIGLAMRDDYCVANFGVVTADGTGGYGLAQWGGQQLPPGTGADYPANNANVHGLLGACSH